MRCPRYGVRSSRASVCREASRRPGERVRGKEELLGARLSEAVRREVLLSRPLPAARRGRPRAGPRSPAVSEPWRRERSRTFFTRGRSSARARSPSATLHTKSVGFFVRDSRSARTSSAVMVSMSARGSSVSETWTMSLFSKQRTTWRIASTSRAWARNLLPSPSPLLAPFTRPARSTSSRAAGAPSEAVAGGATAGPDHRGADVLLDRAERVVRDPRVAGSREGVEERRLPDVRKADDRGAEHGLGRVPVPGPR